MRKKTGVEASSCVLPHNWGRAHPVVSYVRSDIHERENYVKNWGQAHPVWSYVRSDIHDEKIM